VWSFDSIKVELKLISSVRLQNNFNMMTHFLNESYIGNTQSQLVSNLTQTHFSSNLFSVINNRLHQDLDLKFFSLSDMIAFDTLDNCFFLRKNGSTFIEFFHSKNISTMNEQNQELNEQKMKSNEELNSNDDDLIIDLECKHFDSIYNLANSTTIAIWNASTSCILVVGSSSGTIRIFKLLHQF
jgi:hypothetical protein